MHTYYASKYFQNLGTFMRKFNLEGNLPEVSTWQMKIVLFHR